MDDNTKQLLIQELKKRISQKKDEIIRLEIKLRKIYYMNIGELHKVVREEKVK